MPEDGRVRLTEQEGQLNLRAVLELCASGKVRCSERTGRPSAATIRTVTSCLADGDFYTDEPIAALAWPLLLQAGGLAKLDPPQRLGFLRSGPCRDLPARAA